MLLINAGLTYECGFIWTFVIAFFRCILKSYFPVPVFIIVRSKQQENLSKAQRAVLKQLKNDKQMKVYPFDKGTGIALLNDIDSISKIEEQLGKSKIIDCDHTNLLTGKF